MDRKTFNDRIHRAITYAREFAKGVDKADRTYRKLVHLKTEARPANRTYIPAYIRKLIFIRDKYRCVKCGSKKNLEFHHEIPDKMISSNGPKNLQLLCRRCNRMKGVD